MRVAVLATNRNPLVQPFAGGQESMTALLVQRLRQRGHHIRLYAAAGTPTDAADEVLHYPELPQLSMVARLDPQVPEENFLRDHHAMMFAVSDLLRRKGSFDVVHNQTLHHLPLSVAPALAVPVLTTLHTPPFPWMELGAALAGPNSRYVAVSESLAKQWTTLEPRPTVIHNGIDPQSFSLGQGGEALVWVGRLVPEKAPHLAMQTAAALGMPLRLAGPAPDADYYAAMIAPLLTPTIEHVGHLNHSESADLMGSSAALLMTPQWDEPFGLVAAEAALTGTPVVSVRRGGLAEVILPGMGILVPQAASAQAQVRALAGAVPEALGLDRGTVRHTAMAHFGVERMADDYEDLLMGLTRVAQ